MEIYSYTLSLLNLNGEGRRCLPRQGEGREVCLAKGRKMMREDEEEEEEEGREREEKEVTLHSCGRLT